MCPCSSARRILRCNTSPMRDILPGQPPCFNTVGAMDSGMMMLDGLRLPQRWLMPRASMPLASLVAKANG